MPARLLLLTPLLALLLAAPACRRASAPAGAMEEGARSGGFPVVVEDAAGRRVVLPARPERIVPATAGAFDLLAALVEPGRLAAIPATSVAYGSLQARPEFAALPRFARFTGEELLPHRPDLVVVGSWQRADALRALRGAGAAVLRLGEVRRFEDVLADIERLGRATGEEGRAREVIEDLRRRREVLERRAQNAPRLRALRAMTYLNFGTGGWTAGARTTGDLLLRLAGARNAAEEAGISGNAQIDHERLLAIDPDVLVLRATVAGEEHSSTADYLLAEPALAGLSAVRAHRFVVLPAALFSTDSQHLLDAAERLQAEFLALLDRPAPAQEEGHRGPDEQVRGARGGR